MYRPWLSKKLVASWGWLSRPHCFSSCSTWSHSTTFLLCLSLLKCFSTVLGENPVGSCLQTEDIISSCICQLARDNIWQNSWWDGKCNLPLRRRASGTGKLDAILVTNANLPGTYCDLPICDLEVNYSM